MATAPTLIVTGMSPFSVPMVLLVTAFNGRSAVIAKCSGVQPGKMTRNDSSVKRETASAGRWVERMRLAVSRRAPSLEAGPGPFAFFPFAY